MNDEHPAKPFTASIHRFAKPVTLFEDQHGEAEETAEVFQQARAKSREAIMLDIQLTDGTVESFDYGSLRRMKFRPDGSLLMRFGKDEVFVEGRNLERVRELISEHRARKIQEGTDTESAKATASASAMHIERITITEGDDEL
jgi:hypothetical protein